MMEHIDRTHSINIFCKPMRTTKLKPSDTCTYGCFGYSVFVNTYNDTTVSQLAIMLYS